MKKFLLIIFILAISASYAQPWMQKFENKENPNFFEIEKEFNDYWVGKDFKVKASGWKPFKRWLEFWRPRVDNNGEFPKVNNEFFALRDLEKQNKSNGVQAASNWTLLGPTTSNGGYGGIGRVNCVRVNQSNGFIWAGAAAGGVWKSTNSGATWSTVTDNISIINSLGVSDIAIHPTNSNIMYIATGDMDGGNTKSIGVMKSTDAGSTWATTGLSFTVNQGRYIGKLLIDPSNPNILLAAGNAGTYRSTDAGNTWTTTSANNVKDMEFYPGNPAIVYASGSKFYRSSNNGQTWIQITSGLANDIQRASIAVTAANPDYVYILATNTSSYFKALYRSTDGGVNFTTQSTTPNIMGYELNGSGTGGQGWYDNCIAVNPNNANEVYIGGINIWKSTNGGVNWTIKTFWYFQNGYAEVHADQHDLWFDNSTGYLYGGNDGGVYRSTNNGDNWSYINSTMPITQFYKISTSKVSTPVTIGGTQDNGTKLSYNGNWTDEIGGDGMECIVSHSNSLVIYGSIYYGNIQKSTNGGNSFKKINDLDGNNNYDQITETGNWVTPYMLAPNDANTLYVGMLNLWKSTDAGNTFAKITTITTGSKIAIIAISSSDPNYIYTSTGGNLRYTSDGGDTWNAAVKPGGNTMTYLIVDKLNPLKLYATVSGYTNNDKAYLSTDGGLTWTNISSGLPNVPANCIYETDLPSNRFFAGTDIGVYRYNDATSVWENFNSGMPSVIINELDQQKPSNRLMAGTYARGIYYFDLNSLLNIVGSPSLVYPANLDRGRLRDTIKFSWSAVPSATTYNLQVSTSNSFISGNIINQYGINLPQFNASQIDTGVVYYWRVKAYTASDSSAWSSVNTFTTKLKAPYQIYPVQNAFAVPLSGNFLTTPINNTESYNVFLFESGNNNSTTLTSASASITFSALKQGTQYSWIAAGYLNNFSGYESSSQTFTTILNSVNLTLPANNSKAINNSTTFSWTPNTFATKYLIQISKDTDFSNILKTDSVPGIQYNMSGLEYFTKYNWRVKAINNVTESAWSSISAFTTQIQPTLLIQPTNSVYLNKQSIDFLWTDRLSASKYLIQISKDSTFATTDYSSSTFTALQTFKNFAPNVIYAWRVRAINGSDSSDWSPVWKFTIYLDKAKLLTPTDKKENIEVKDVTINWNKVAFANAYKVYFSESQPFDTTKFTQTTDTFLVPTKVEMNKKYYWSVIGFNTNNQSDSINTFSFTTTADRPVLTAPTNLAKNINKDNLIFTWTSLSNTTIYELVYSDKVDFTGGKPNTDTIKTNIASQAANFTTNSGKKYYWKVRALINGEYTNWSETWEFKTSLEIVKQELPIDKTTNVELKPSLTWETTSSPFYQVNISEFAGFNQFDEYNLSSLELKITNKKLKPQTTYYWKVRAIFTDDTSSWSEVWTFKTLRPNNVLISPLTNLKQQDFVQNLIWESNPDFESYKLELAKDSLFANIVESTVKSDNSHTTKRLDIETRYYWRVIADLGNLITIPSEVWNFTTKDLMSVNEDKTKFFISPNPANNYLNLNLLVNDDTDWSFEIIDITSKSIISGNVKSGSTVIDLQGLANGKYFIKATNGKSIYSDKFDVSK